MDFSFAQVLGAFLGTTEILIILFIVLLLFGAKKLPELAKGLGKSINEFKKASSPDEEEKPATKVASAETAKPSDPAKPGNN